MSQVYKLDGLTLLEDATGGSEAVEVFVDEFRGNLANLLIGKTLDWINQKILVDEERISRHLSKVFIWKLRLTVGDEV